MSCFSKKLKKSENITLHPTLYLCANRVDIMRKFSQRAIHGFTITLALKPGSKVSGRISITYKYTKHHCKEHF